MTVKRFVAPDMRRALDLVRQEMGPDAIILSSKRVKDGVEVLTAEELDLPTRGYDTRQAFGQQFDPEADRPLRSDQAWNPRLGGAQVGDRPYTPPPVNDSAARASQLAQEIDAARERMLAAKRSAEAANRPIGGGQRIEPRLDVAARLDDYPTRRHEPRMDFETLGNIVPMPAAEPAPRQDRQLAGLAAQVEKMRDANREPQARSGSDDARLNDLQSELADMRALLQQHIARVSDNTGGASPVNSKTAVNATTLNQNLNRLGLTSDLTERLCDQHGNEPRFSSAWRDALNDLVGQLPVNASDCIDKGGIFAFVGPTGVGKTTTIAKLAARYVLTHGQGKVALVTTDTYRVGAQDQLRSLGRILNVPVRVIDHERSLSAVLASLQAFPLVLIDTAGFRQGDPLLKEQEAMLASCVSVQRILVMAGNSQLQTLKASAHAYKSRRLTGCVLTKLDETLSLGEALSVVIQQAIPLLYTTDGQEIPKDIALASAQHLVAKAVSLTKAQERNERELTGIAR